MPWRRRRGKRRVRHAEPPPNDRVSTTVEGTHIWRIKTRLPERKGERCRIVARGKLNSCLVEFADGVRVVTSRWSVRRVRPPESR